jgi:hypothetical protein
MEQGHSRRSSLLRAMKALAFLQIMADARMAGNPRMEASSTVCACRKAPSQLVLQPMCEKARLNGRQRVDRSCERRKGQGLANSITGQFFFLLFFWKDASQIRWRQS